jgi:hypothetical protein
VDLTWWVVAIAGCVALALCIAVVLLQPMDAERRRLRPLANVGRLTRLPEYVRAARIRASSMIAAIVLLTIVFAGAVVAAARPTGLPSAAGESGTVQPEDIMLCVGGPITDRATGAMLRYFSEQVKTFDTQRIGLTSPNRRVIPLTRDYQYAAAQLAGYAQVSEQQGDVDGRRRSFAPPVSYENYTPRVEDVLALCLTGFPAFDQPSGQRRSVIYVGPGSLGEPGDRTPALFTADRVERLAKSGGAQVNVLVTGAPDGTLTGLANATGGRALPADSGMAAQLSEIRDHPPAATATDDTARTKPTESPDVPIVAALIAALALAVWPVAVRR